MNQPKKKRPTVKELRAQAEAERQQALEAFEAARESRWFYLMASAQRIVLALERYPEFSQLLSGDEYGYRRIKVDLENDAIEIDEYALGRITKQSITLDQADKLEMELEFLEGQFTRFIATRQRQARQLKTLKRLKIEAMRKLTVPEKIALGVYNEGKDCTVNDHANYFRNPEGLSEQESALLEPELVKDL